MSQAGPDTALNAIPKPSTLPGPGGDKPHNPSPALIREALPLRDWLLGDALHDDSQALIAGLAERLNGLGIPVDRISTAIDALHSEYTGIGRIWTREEGSSFRLFPHGPASEEAYTHSPFFLVHESGEWLHVGLAGMADDAFGVMPELKAAGYRDYLVVPLVFSSGTKNGLTLASYTADGFDERALGILGSVMPTVSAAMELLSTNQRLDNVLRIYVGEDPRKAILSGAIQRGQVSRIRSAILFADMRGYTRITSALPPEGAVEILNTFFDCLVPPIEQEGGEILKYLGDGLLAIFRDRGDDTGGTAQSALSAAIDGLVRLSEANRDGRFPVLVEAGIALHHGEAAYGNVGSGTRLDFTVIGRDVNLASRIAGMNKVLGEPLLMSRAFAEHLWGNPESLGLYVLPGLPDPVAIYRLRGGGEAPAEADAAAFSS